MAPSLDKKTRLKVGDKVSVRVGVFGQEYARTRVDGRTPWTTETVRGDGEVTGRDGEMWVVTCSDISVKLKRNEIAFISRPQQWASTPQAVRSSTRILQWVKTDASRWLPRAVRVRMATTKPMTKTRKTTILRSARRPLGLTADRGAPEVPPVRFPWTGRAGVAVEVEKVSVCKCVLRQCMLPESARQSTMFGVRVCRYAAEFPLSICLAAVQGCMVCVYMRWGQWFDELSRR